MTLSMTYKASLNILSGRPFGGIAIRWRKNLSNFSIINSKDENTGRFVSVTINNYFSQSVVISCAYFPWFVNKLDYLVDASAVIACIDNILALNNNCWHLIGGDFNFVCAPFNNNFGYSIFADVISDYNLICCDKYVSNGNHTYQHDSLGHYSLLDHFFISSNMRSFMQSSEILDTGINTSDYLPICICIAYGANAASLVLVLLILLG